MLQFDGRWRFDSPGPIESGADDAFRDLINRIAGQAPRKSILEHFKSRFAAAANIQYWPSSNERFAAEDLTTAMSEAATNAPLFIEAFWLGCEELRLRHPEMVLPDAGRINRILTDTNAGYQLDPPVLVATRVHISIAVPTPPPSLDVQARSLIEQALQASERALAEGNGRQAVQEVLLLISAES